MTIFGSLSELPHIQDAAITIGNFDGLHTGHRRILDGMKEAAGNSVMTAVTFREAPAITLRPGSFPGSIMPPGFKEKLFQSQGFSYLVNLDFPSVASISAGEFLGFLLGRTGRLTLAVGYNFRFGKGNTGSAAWLKEESERLGFSLVVTPPVCMEGSPVSSSRIRNAIQESRFDQAAAMLGRPYFVSSSRVQGDAIGSSIGIPTVNLAHNGQVLPPAGVYYTRSVVRGRIYDSMTYIGRRPTLKDRSFRHEVHIIGQNINVEPGEHLHNIFEKRVRGEKKFNNLEDLRKRIYNDRLIICKWAESRHPGSPELSETLHLLD